MQDRRLIVADVDEESGLPAPNLYYPAFVLPEEGGPCRECKGGGKLKENLGASPGISTRKKLLFLLLVASLSLLSIVLISEQLIARHLERSNKNDEGDDGIVEVFNILTLEEWAKKAASEDTPVDHAADSLHGVLEILFSRDFASAFG